MPIFKCDWNVALGGIIWREKAHSGMRMAFLNAPSKARIPFAYVINMTSTMPQIVSNVFPTA